MCTTLSHNNITHFMRIAVISDIHSNLPALEAVLAKARELNAERFYCLGDLVGYGPFPNECIELVRSHCPVVIKGNHDSGLLGETPTDDFNSLGQQAIKWTKKQITPQNLDYLRRLPLLSVQNDVTLVHASPAEPDQWTYVLTLRSAEECFGAFTTNLCFIGHTHVPVIIGDDMSINAYKPPSKNGPSSSRFLINVGSVGQPRDGNPFAAFGIIDTETWNYELIRVEYDIEKTATAITNAGLPIALAKRLFQGV